MRQVKAGDTVQVHYHGKLTNGTTFDSSSGREPLEFEVGTGSVIKGFDEGVLGMAVGDKKTLEIPFSEGYGPKDENMVVEFPRANLPDDLNPELGMQLSMTVGSGQVIPVTIVQLGDETVTLDANSPLAGQDLVFDVEIVDIKGPSSIILPG